MSQKVQQLKNEIQDGREGSLMNSLDIILYFLISFFFRSHSNVETIRSKGFE